MNQPNRGNTLIAIGGSPHSGKTVFSSALYQKLLERRSSGIFLARVCPDGEGMWSSEADPKLVKSLRRKGEFSEEFVTITLKSIDRLRNGSDLPIVLLDLGGKRSPENAEILKRAHFCILLSSQPAEIELWQAFAFAQGCEAISKLESRLDTTALVKSHINFEQVPVTGILWNLDREAGGKSYEAAIAQFADWLIERFD